MTPSKRQRKHLKRWAKGKAIKVREIQEFATLGWIVHESRLLAEGHYMSRPVISDAGREVIGRNTKTIFD